MSPIRTLTVGRIVLYQPPQRFEGVDELEVPAIVTCVYGPHDSRKAPRLSSADHVHLTVFASHHRQMPAEIVLDVPFARYGQARAAGCWRWPPIV
jgi:hypothetical protein